MKMSLIVFGAGALSTLLRRRSAALRHWVLAAGIGCGAAMPVLVSSVPAWHLPLRSPTAVIPYAESFYDSASQRPTEVRPARVPGAAPRPAQTRRGIDLISVVPAIWFAGALTGIGILLVGLVRLAWLAARVRPITHGRWAELVREISDAYGLRQPVRLLQTSHPSLLVTWGLVHPKVILPLDADAWSDERARVVLLHELAHISRRDWLVQVFAQVVRACYWFNPLLWIACRQLRLESEHACDDEVIRRGLDGPDYAGHLIELARALKPRTNVWVPAPAMARSSSLERRVRAMLNNACDRRSMSRSSRTVIFIALLGLSAAVAAAQSSFATFSGSIADESARGIPGATVTLTSEARQAKYEVKTGAIGRFEFVGLPPGEYAAQVVGIGFQSLKDAVTISGQNVQRSYTLKLGTLQETIVVTEGGKAPASPVREVVPKPRPPCVPPAAGGQIVPPRKIRDYTPAYPENLRGTGVGGTVVMDGRIALDGFITDIRVVDDAHPDFASAAVAAVREWKFTETLLNCQPVDVVLNITVNFKPAPPALQAAPR